MDAAPPRPPENRKQHVKHMGFELEADAQRIVAVLVVTPEGYRESILKHLSPKKLQMAVRDMLESEELCSTS